MRLTRGYRQTPPLDRPLAGSNHRAESDGAGYTGGEMELEIIGETFTPSKSLVEGS